MTAAVPAGQKQGSWRQLGFGLGAFLLLPLIPVVRSIVPIEQTLLLIVPAVAVCALVGWKLGGRAALAVIWLVLAVWILMQHAGNLPEAASDRSALAVFLKDKPADCS